MKKLLQHLTMAVLSLALVLVFIPALPGGTASAVSFNTVSVNTTFSVSTSSPIYYKAHIPESANIDGMYAEAENWAVVMKCCDAGGTPTITQVNASGNAIGDTHETWGGNELEAIKATAGTDVYFKIEGGLGSKFAINVYPYPGNSTEATAYQLSDNVNVKGFNQLTECISKHDYGVQYYYIKAAEKAKFKIRSNDFSLYVKNGTGKYEILEKGTTGTYQVNKGSKLYIELVTKQEAGAVAIYRDIFNRMTSMKLNKTSYSLVSGNPLSFKLSFNKLNSNKELESTISKKGLYSKSTGKLIYTVKQKDINNYETEALKTPGIYNLKLVNSEGKTAEARVTVKPRKPSISGYTATGKTKSTKIKIFDTLDGIDGFAVFVKNSKGKYIKKGYTSHLKSGYNTYNIKGLKPNKIYYVKVKAYKKSGNTKIYSNFSDAVKVVTAPAKAPKIKSAKATGTKYHKAKKEYHAGYYDAGWVWHKSYYTSTPANSTAAVKVKYTKVKGASSYESNGVSFSKGVSGYKLTGKIKAGKKQKVKIRAVKKSGRAIAYGPWSNVKTVKLKAAK